MNSKEDSKSAKGSATALVAAISVICLIGGLVLWMSIRRGAPVAEPSQPTSDDRSSDRKAVKPVDPVVAAAFASAEQELNEVMAREVAFKESGEHPLPPNKPLSRGMNPNIDSVVEALETGQKFERLSPLFVPAPFNKAAFEADPQAYLDVVEPGRVWQSLPPGPGVPSIGNQKSFHTIKRRESVRLAARVVPGAPVTFTSTDLGAFENDLASITVVARDDGWAFAAFTATAGTIGNVNIIAASPMTSGRLNYAVNVVE